MNRIFWLATVVIGYAGFIVAGFELGRTTLALLFGGVLVAHSIDIFYRTPERGPYPRRFAPAFVVASLLVVASTVVGVLGVTGFIEVDPLIPMLSGLVVLGGSWGIARAIADMPERPQRDAGGNPGIAR